MEELEFEEEKEKVKMSQMKDAIAKKKEKLKK